jgi:hypothetical protein
MASKILLPRVEINGVFFSLDTDLKAWGFAFERNIKYGKDAPMEYWKAQLTLRGFSSRGSNIDALKERLHNANAIENVQDSSLVAAYNKTLQARAQGTKRKTTDRLDEGRPAPAARLAPAAPTSQPRRLAPASRPSQPARSAPAASVSRPIAAAQPGRPDEFIGEFIADCRLAKKRPGLFLRQAFFDDGHDAGYVPIALPGLSPADRSRLHQAADQLGLYHKMSNNDIVVFGSGKNILGQKLLIDINAGRYETDEESEDVENKAEQNKGVQYEDEESENEQSVDEEKEDDEEDDEPWDITGEWDILCPGMADCFGQYSPYTMTICSSGYRGGTEIYGEFDLGEYKGVLRFISDNRFIFNANDTVSAQDDTRFYCWRGKETGEEVIILGSEKSVSRMKFSNGGNTVEGTWNSTSGDPGEVKFTGTKTGGHGYVDIHQEWRDHNEVAYGKADRDRWR